MNDTKTADHMDNEDRIANALDLAKGLLVHLSGAFVSIVHAREGGGDELAMKNAQREIFRALENLTCLTDALDTGAVSVADELRTVLEHGADRRSR